MRATSFGLAAVGVWAVGVANANTWQGPAGTGGTGNWNQPTYWSDGTTPNSSLVDVLIDGGKAAASDVTITAINPSTHNLIIDTGDTLHIAPGYSLSTYGSTVISGTLEVNASTNSAYYYVYGTSAGPVSISGGGTLTLTGSASYQPRIYNQYSNNKLSLGSGLTISAGGGANFYGWIDSNASMGVSTSGRTLTIQGYDAAHRFTNNATLSASNNSTLQMDYFTNAGTISVNNATLLLGSAFATSDLGAITRSGASTVAITGTMDNTTATLTLNGTTGSYDLRGGTIKNGTISTTAGSILNVASGQSGTLDGVTIAAGSDVKAVSAGSGSSLYAQNNLTVNGTITLDASANSGTPYLYVGNSNSTDQSIAGTGTIRLTNGGNSYTPRFYNQYSTTSKVTLGSGLTVDAAGGGYFYGWVTSNANIGVSTSGRTLTIQGYDATHRFVNNATLSASNNSTLTLDTFTNAGTLSVDNSTLAFSGNYSTTDIGAVTRTGASTITLAGTLNNTGATLSLNATTGTYEVRGVTIRNGNLTTTGGASLTVPSGYSGTFDNTTLTAGSDIKILNGGYIYAQNGMTLNGTLTLDASASNGTPYLYFTGTGDQLVGGTGTIRLLAGGTSYVPRIYNQTSSYRATVGSGLTIDASGGGNVTGWVISNAPMSVNTSGRTLAITGYDDTHRFVSNSTITASNGSTLTLDTFTNNGTINVANSTLLFSGNYSTADMGAVTRTGTSTVALSGTLENTGNTLALNATTGSYDLRSVTIRYGTLSTTGGAILNVASGSPVFTGVTLAAGSDVSVKSSNSLYVQGGMTLNGTVTLDASPNNGTPYLYFQGGIDQTIGGSGTLRLTPSTSYTPQVRVYDNTGKATLGSGLTVDAAGGGTFYGWMANNASFGVSTSGKTLTIQGYDASHRFTNAGTLSASNSSTLSLSNFTNSGTISANNATVLFTGNYVTGDIGAVTRAGTSTVAIAGLLDNTAATLTLTAATGSYELRSSGEIKNGTVTTSGGASVNVQSGNSGYLENLTLTAGSTAQALGNGSLYVQKGLVLNGTLSANASANTGTPYIYFTGDSDQTVSGSGTVSLVGSTSYSANISNQYSSSSRQVTFGSGLTVSLSGAAQINGYFTSNAPITIASTGKNAVLSGYDATRPFTNNVPLTVNGGTVDLTNFVNNSYTDIKAGRVEFNYSGAANDPITSILPTLTAGYAVNYATGSVRSSTAVANQIGLGYRDFGSYVAVQRTYFGDADLDGGVSINDFNALSANFGLTGKTWTQGDFDYDGGVSINDFNLLAGNFGKSLGSPSDGPNYAALALWDFAVAHDDEAGFVAATGVPEPAGLALLGGLAAAGLRRRRVAR